MASRQLADLFLGAWGLMFVFSWVWVLMMAIALPMFMLSVSRNLRRIGRALEALGSGSPDTRPKTPGGVIGL